MKLATIETIKEIFPHPNADKLELVKILGWQVVVEKGKHLVGERVVFVVIDTILPFAPWSEFLRDKKDPEKPIRLKTVKLRGEHSRGLVLPLSVLPENVQGWHEGADVSGALEIKKYEKEIPAQLMGEVLGTFPTHMCAQTDEDNGLSNLELVEETLRYLDLTITQKLDGSSCTIIIENNKISQVCSRRLSLKESDKNSFWWVAHSLKLEELDSYRYVFQGELMGPGIQGNQLQLKEPTLFVYQVNQIKHLIGEAAFCPYAKMARICSSLGCGVVPLIVDRKPSTEYSLEKLQEIADRQSLPNGTQAEGIVVRPSGYPAAGNGRPLGFKLINKNYVD